MYIYIYIYIDMYTHIEVSMWVCMSHIRTWIDGEWESDV